MLVRNSSHYGAASYYAELAAARGMLGVSLSNSDPGMAPVGTLGPVLGTNPLAIAAPAPAGTVAPTLDIATSEVAQGKVILHQRAGRPIPAGWGIGPDGAPTTDPAAALAGAVLPFAGHKGFGLSFMFDVLCGAAAGALTSPHIPGDPADPRPQGLGHAFVAIDLAACDPGGRLRGVAAGPRRPGARRAARRGLRRAARPGRARGAAARASGPTASRSTTRRDTLLTELGAEFGVPFPGAPS